MPLEPQDQIKEKVKKKLIRSKGANSTVCTFNIQSILRGLSKSTAYTYSHLTMSKVYFLSVTVAGLYTK